MSPPPQFFRPPLDTHRSRTAGCGDERRHKLATIEEDNLTRDELDSIAQEIVEGQLTAAEELAAR